MTSQVPRSPPAGYVPFRNTYIILEYALNAQVSFNRLIFAKYAVNDQKPNTRRWGIHLPPLTPLVSSCIILFAVSSWQMSTAECHSIILGYSSSYRHL